LELLPKEPRLAIDRRTLQEVIAHLRNHLPFEGCGLLATVTNGNGVRVVLRFFPGDNIDRSTSRFTMDPYQVASALNEMERQQWELGAIVHSHPNSTATPSITDVREVFYPRAWMAIVSFASELPEARVWRMERSEEILPVELALSIMLE
jgi:proteasome lid subunit RPN8/RPN11